jgi:hypothetical protein
MATTHSDKMRAEKKGRDAGKRGASSPGAWDGGTKSAEWHDAWRKGNSETYGR